MARRPAATAAEITGFGHPSSLRLDAMRVGARCGPLLGNERLSIARVCVTIGAARGAADLPGRCGLAQGVLRQDHAQGSDLQQRARVESGSAVGVESDCAITGLQRQAVVLLVRKSCP